jgi:hypothetical protein
MFLINVSKKSIIFLHPSRVWNLHSSFIYQTRYFLVNIYFGLYSIYLLLHRVRERAMRIQEVTKNIRTGLWVNVGMVGGVCWGGGGGDESIDVYSYSPQLHVFLSFLHGLNPHPPQNWRYKYDVTYTSLWYSLAYTVYASHPFNIALLDL